MLVWDVIGISEVTRPEKCFNTLKRGHLLLRMGRMHNFIRIEYRIEYPRNFEYELNIESNTNFQWLLMRSEYTWPRAMFLFSL